ncbi:MAG: anti-sigma factor domain-containing protein [Clostridiales bacterium]
MILSGIVIKISKKYLSVMTKDMMFLKIENRFNVKKGQYVYFSDDDIIKKYKSYKFSRHIVAAFVIFALILFLFIYNNGDKVNKTEYAFVEFETDASIEFIVDDEFNIIRYRSLNDKGQNLIDKNNIESNELDLVINKLYRSNLNSIKEDDTLYISTCAIGSDVELNELKNKSDVFLKKIENYSFNIKTYLYNNEIKKIANEYNMSGLRYLLFSYLNYKGDSMVFNELNNYSVSMLLQENNISNIDALINGIKIQENEIEEFAINEKDDISTSETVITAKPTKIEEKESTETTLETPTETKNVNQKKDFEDIVVLDEGTIKVEAEDINYYGATLKSDIFGYTGIGFLEGFKGKNKYFSLKLKTDKAAQYDMWIRYKNINENDDKDTDVYLNGNNLNDAINYIKLNQDSNWNKIDYELNLVKGVNTLKLLSLDNEYRLMLDNIKFIYVEY